MTDLATKPDADEASAVAGAPADAPSDPGDPGSTSYAWAPTEPAPKKRRLGLWIGIGVGVAAAAVATASLVLIAPGTTVAGVPVGFLTAGAATDALQQRLADTTITLTGDGGDATLTGADLGAAIDARALADDAFATHPMWNLAAWNAEPIDAVVTVDPEVATAALRAAAPDLYTDPVDATLTYDAVSLTYGSTPAVDGVGIDVAVVLAALQEAYDSGATTIDASPATAPVGAETPTFVAESTAANLNGILTYGGFYVGTERTVPVPREVIASWLTVEPGERGTFEITADESAIETLVGGLAAAVDRPAVNASVVTNSAGAVLREDAVGVAGRQLGDTSDIASDFADLLATGRGDFQLPVTEVAFESVTLARTVEVDISAQRAYLYENGQLVKELIVSTGLPGSVTPQGRFTVNGYSRVQNMGCFEGAPYCVENVPWVTWFAPDIGFHGASALRSRLGFPQSHGCVNVWDADAKFVYDWTANGTEVWVHA